MTGKQLAEERTTLKEKIKNCDKKQSGKIRKILQANIDLLDRFSK